MKKVMLFLFVAILATSCNAQDTENSSKNSSDIEIQKDSLQRPKGNWKVNKEVDENGNIIRYDSIYSWSSSGNIKDVESDSIFNQMHTMMQKRFSMLQSPNLNDFAERDSIMKQFFSDDFFKDDFFSNRVPPGFQNMDEIMKQMEAMRQNFFNNQNRYIIPPENTEPKEKKTKTIEKKQV
ncbi:hypothetical protein [Winogradskyella algicola]|uniref:hypothetical protein n=1 Tax=Winogradskyella algicola TaxID=2575815 RepID=UPI0011083E35|nr:hypothetical protein [Winogradskyella algicola]